MGRRHDLGGGGAGLVSPDAGALALALALLALVAGAVRFDDHLLPPANRSTIAAAAAAAEPPALGQTQPEARAPGQEVEAEAQQPSMQQEPGDLLAVESTRLLAIGNQPPYAANSTRPHRGGLKLGAGASLQSPLRLYRLSQSAQATPIFLRQPASGQDLRLYLYPDQAHNSSQVGLKVRPASRGPEQDAGVAQQSANITEQSRSSANKIFPSVAAEPSLEDEFERQLATGHYQRIASAPTNITWAQLLRQASLDNVMESLMVTNRSRVSLVCDTDDMLLRLSFRQPFRGLVATRLDRLKSCRLAGTGAHHYEWRIPLNSCGTRQEQPRLFINNIQIQFHQQQQLDTADDELKTLVCSYPLRPRAPPPDPQAPLLGKGLSERIIEQPAETPVRLVHYEPLVLISGLLLLALTLLGLAAGAYLVTRRHRRHRRLRSLSSSSNISARLYRPPAQLANLRLAPPLISISKTSKRPRQHPAVDAIQYSQPVSLEPRLQSNQNNTKVPSSDSLATDRSSVTTIEIPFLKPTGDKKLEQQDPSNPLALDADQKDQRKTSPAPARKPKRRTLTKEREVQVDSGPPRFGSLRATLTSPNEFRRLQDIARLFDEILIEEHVDKGNDKTLVFKTTRLSPSKYKTKILDSMDQSERRQVSKLIGQDELFRSLVVESTNLETFRRKLRNSPIYKDLLKPDTWNLLEEILLDSDLTLNASRESIDHHQLEPVDQKNNQQELVHFEEPVKEESVLAQREILPHSSTRLSKVDDKATNIHHQISRSASSPSNHYRKDSLEDQWTGKKPRLEVGSRVRQEQEVGSEGESENKVKRSVVKVRQFNSTKTVTNGGGDGFGSTMINIDSVTNFSTSSGSKEGFSTFTRSSIEHNRYHASGIGDSSGDDDQRL